MGCKNMCARTCSHTGPQLRLGKKKQFSFEQSRISKEDNHWSVATHFEPLNCHGHFSTKKSILPVVPAVADYGCVRCTCLSVHVRGEDSIIPAHSVRRYVAAVKRKGTQKNLRMMWCTITVFVSPGCRAPSASVQVKSLELLRNVTMMPCQWQVCFVRIKGRTKSKVGQKFPPATTSQQYYGVVKVLQHNDPLPPGSKTWDM
eukprot:6478595-Amphidinium_carterae.3